LLPFSHTRPVSPYPCTHLPPRQTSGSSSQILHISIPSPPPSGERQQGHAMNTMVPYLSHAASRTLPNVLLASTQDQDARLTKPPPRPVSRWRAPTSSALYHPPPAPADVPAMCTDANRMEAMALVQPPPGPASMCSLCHMHEWTKRVVSSAHP